MVRFVSVRVLAQISTT